MLFLISQIILVYKYYSNQALLKYLQKHDIKIIFHQKYLTLQC
jgi:ABC-type sulfate transport system permease subunit